MRICSKNRLFYAVRAGTEQEETNNAFILETVSSDKKRSSMQDFEILVDHENLVTISCFRTFLIFIQSYIFNFCIYFKCFFLYIYIHIHGHQPDYITLLACARG